MNEVYVEDLIAPNYDELLDSVMNHDYSNFILKGGRGSLKSSFIGFGPPAKNETILRNYLSKSDFS